MFSASDFGLCALPVSSQVVAQIVSQAAMIDTCHLRPGIPWYTVFRAYSPSLEVAALSQATSGVFSCASSDIFVQLPAVAVVAVVAT